MAVFLKFLAACAATALTFWALDRVARVVGEAMAFWAQVL